MMMEAACSAENSASASACAGTLLRTFFYIKPEYTAPAPARYCAREQFLGPGLTSSR